LYTEGNFDYARDFCLLVLHLMYLLTLVTISQRLNSVTESNNADVRRRGNFCLPYNK